MKDVAARILIVHGDAGRARAIAKVLADEAFSSETAGSAATAIRKAQVNDYDVVVVGHETADMSACDAIAGLRAADVSAPIIYAAAAVSRGTVSQDETRVLSAGADFYLPGDFHIPDHARQDIPDDEAYGAQILAGMVRAAIRRYRGELDTGAAFCELDAETLARTKTGVDVLIVQDCDSWTRTATQTLESAGHAVVETPSGEEGVELAVEYDFDIIYVDDSAVDQSGFRTMQQMRDAGVSAPIVFVSIIEQYWPIAYDRGADHYLSIFSGRDVMLAQARQALRRWRREETQVWQDDAPAEKAVA